MVSKNIKVTKTFYSYSRFFKEYSMIKKRLKSSSTCTQ